jgi:hypothetical protein
MDPLRERASSTARASLMMIAIVVVVGGCSLFGTDQGNPPPLTIRNDASVAVALFLSWPDGTESPLCCVSGIGPGQAATVASVTYPGKDCSATAILIARDRQGTEIARRNGRMCPGDAWTVR